MRPALFLLALVPLVMSGQVFAQAAQVTVSTDRQIYHANDTITVSGKVSPAPQAGTAILQVYNTFNVMVQVGTIKISQDGSYATAIKAQGSGWQNDGVYTIKVIYASPPVTVSGTATVNFNAAPAATQSPPASSTVQSSSTSQSESQALSTTQQSTTQTNDAQIPFWVKDTARKWHDGLADNMQFGKVIQYMISSGLVSTSYTITPQDTFDNTPSWVRTTAGWWSQGLVSDADFVGAIQFLLNDGVIEP